MSAVQGRRLRTASRQRQVRVRQLPPIPETRVKGVDQRIHLDKEITTGSWSAKEGSWILVFCLHCGAIPILVISNLTVCAYSTVVVRTVIECAVVTVT